MTDPACIWYRETHKHGAEHVWKCMCGDDWQIWCNAWGRIAARYQWRDLDIAMGKIKCL